MTALWTWLANSWLGRKVMAYLGKKLLVFLKTIWATKKKELREDKLEKIIEKVENAKTPEEKQDAIDDVAKHWGK